MRKRAEGGELGPAPIPFLVEYTRQTIGTQPIRASLILE